MSQHWRDGDRGAEWKRVRLMVLARDHYRCRLTLTGCEFRATHVHHTRSRALVGDDPRYLVAACAHCNLSLGDPTSAAATAAPSRHTQWW